MKASIADRIREALRQENLSGRLVRSFHGSDPISENIPHPWQRFHCLLAGKLASLRGIFTPYSPRNAIPYLSRADTCAIEFVRRSGIDVVSSADRVRILDSVWPAEQAEPSAAAHLRQVVDATFRKVARRICRKEIPCVCGPPVSY